MDYTRIAKLHRTVFSTPQNSPEREQAVSALSDEDLSALYEYDMAYITDNLEKFKINEQEENGNMTYEQYKNKIVSGKKGIAREVSQFAMENPAQYRLYREQFMKEQKEEQDLRNR